MFLIIKNWIVNIVIISIIGIIVENLLSTERMKKHIKLVLGFIIMIVVLDPILKIINYDFDKLVFKIDTEIDKEFDSYDFVNEKNKYNFNKNYTLQIENLYTKKLETEIIRFINEQYNSINISDVKISLEKEGNISEKKDTYAEKSKNNNSLNDFKTVNIKQVTINYSYIKGKNVNDQIFIKDSKDSKDSRDSKDSIDSKDIIDKVSENFMIDKHKILFILGE